MVKKLFVSEDQQITYLIKSIAFIWFITKVWSYKTWIADRIYPIIPPSDLFENIPSFAHVFLFLFSLICLLLVLFLEKNRLILTLLFVSELLSCSLDTVRWQPWEYMYLCIILLAILNFRKPKNIIFLLHLFLVSMYFYSGLQKFSRDFLSSMWLNVILTDFFGLSMNAILKYKLFFVGLFIPFFEILLSILLFISKSKRKISFLLILMHIGILILIGPFGLLYNSIVWFWNLALIGILMIVYAKPIEPLNVNFLSSNFYWILLWFVMPVFSFFGYWYQYFSLSLYSGKGYEMYFCVSEKEKDLKPYFETQKNICGNIPCINLQNWAMSELKSAPIPEPEIFNKIEIYMKKHYKNENLKVILYDSQTKKMVK